MDACSIISREVGGVSFMHDWGTVVLCVVLCYFMCVNIDTREIKSEKENHKKCIPNAKR